MKITKARIKGFGKFVNREFSFQSGLNVIYGPNESGKTTLADFLTFTLSGFRYDELEKYVPWSGDELGGSITLERSGGEKIELDLDPHNPSEERLLKRIEFELSSYVPEESGLDIESGVGGVVLAKLKKRMEELERMEKIVEILGSTQRIYETLAEKEEAVKKEIESVEEELRELEEKFRRERDLRRRYLENRKKLVKLEKDLEVFEKELLASRIMESRKLWKEMDDLRIEISNLGVEISRLKKYTKVDLSLLEKVDELVEELKGIETRLSKMEEELKRLEEEEEEISSRMEEIGRRINVEGEEEADRVVLKIRNLELVHRMYLEKISALGDFKEKWRMFENEEEVERKVQKIEEIIESMEEMETELERYGSESERIEEEMRGISKSIAMRNVLAWILVGVAAVLSYFSLQLSELTYGVGAGAVAGLTLAIFFSTIGLRRKRNSLEDELTRYELNTRVLQRKLENLKEELKRELYEMGFESVDEFKKEYAEYLRWRERVKRHLESKEVKDLENELREGLKEFYGDVVEKYGELIEELKRYVNEYVELREKLKLVRLSKETTRARMEDLERAKRAVEGELEGVLEKLECESVSDCKSIRDGIRKYEELVKKREKLEERLREKRSQWDKVKQYFDMELPSGIDPDSIEPEDVVKTKIENVKLERDEIEKRLIEIMGEIKSVEVKQEEWTEKLEKMADLKLRLEKASAEVKIYPEVLTVLSTIRDEFIGKYKERFQKRFIEILRRIRGEDLPISVRDDLSLELTVGGVESMSRAVKDQIELAYRIALHDTLSPEDPYPLIIDNTLVRYDDERLGNTLDLLKDLSKERQVILTTSDSRVLEHVPKRSVKTLERD